MDLALIASAGLLGLLGAPHCAAMCSAPCGALLQRCGGGRSATAFAGFMGGRLLGYMAGGAAVAAGVAFFAAVGELAPTLRPLWAMAHVATLLLGGWMLLVGKMPRWLGGVGQVPQVFRAAGGPVQAVPIRVVPAGALRAGAVGTFWVAMPCGLLQSALIVAALASTPWQGAAAMGAFAMASSAGLAAFPVLGLHRMSGERATRWVVRASGALLLVASGWALGHGLWQRVAALCAGG